jgi:hypothetical protein
MLKIYLTQALVSFKKYMPPPLPYFKVNICTFPVPHFASIQRGYITLNTGSSCHVNVMGSLIVLVNKRAD